MIEINDIQKFDVCGSGFNWGWTVIIGSTLSFFAGLFEGIVNPGKCN